MSAKETEK